MYNLMLLESTFGAKVLSAIWAQEWSLQLMNWSNMSLNIDWFGELLITVRTRMNKFLVVGQMHLFMDFQLFLTIESLRTLWTHECCFIQLRMNLLHVIVKWLLMWIHFITLLATERNKICSDDNCAEFFVWPFYRLRNSSSNFNSDIFKKFRHAFSTFKAETCEADKGPERIQSICKWAEAFEVETQAWENFFHSSLEKSEAFWRKLSSLDINEKKD